MWQPVSQLVTHSQALSVATDHLMQTRRSSPPQAPPPPQAEASAKAQWSKADEIALIEYITEHKAEAGDGTKFKPSFWTGTAKEMLSHCALGGVKTSQACSSKWDRVCTKRSRVAILLLTFIYPAQKGIQ